MIVPACGEAGTIGAVLDGLRAAGFAEVVVVDDGSADLTASIAARRGARVIRHQARRGYGAALKTGLAACTSARVAIIDADGTYDARDLAEVVAACPEGGMAVGAREREPALLRRALKAGARRWIERTTGARVPDVNSGLRAFDRRLAQRLADRLPDRFSFTTTMTLGALALGAPVAFVTVRYGRRAGSRSKFGALDAVRFARTVARGARWVREGRVSAPQPASWRWAAALIAAIAVIALVPAGQLSALAVPIAFGLAAYLPFVLAKVARWRMLLAEAGVELSAREAFEAYVAGLAFGAVTPGRAGELVRIAGPARAGHPIAALAATTAIDRLFDLGAVALAAGLSGLAVGGAPLWAVAASGLAGALFGGLFILAPLASAVSRRLARGPRIAEVVRAATRPRVLAEAALWTALSMSAFFAVATLLLDASGVDAPRTAQLAAVAAGNLAALVPVTVGGLGSREGAILTVLTLAGASASPAAPALYAVAFHTVFTLSPWLLLAATLALAPPACTARAAEEGR